MSVKFVLEKIRTIHKEVVRSNLNMIPMDLSVHTGSAQLKPRNIQRFSEKSTSSWVCATQILSILFDKQSPEPPWVIMWCSDASAPAGGADSQWQGATQQQPGIPPYLTTPLQIKSGLEIEAEYRAPSYWNRDSVSITSPSRSLSDSMTSDECNLHSLIWHITECLPRTT